MKKTFAVLLAVAMVFSLVACGGSSSSTSTSTTTTTTAATSSANTEPAVEVGQVVTGVEAVDTVAQDGKDYNHMTMEELYELAKAEGGTIEVYSTTTDANTAVKKFLKAYPDIPIEYITIDTNQAIPKFQTEYDTNNIFADVAFVADKSGEIYNELVQYGILEVYYPATVVAHMDPESVKYGLPVYASFNPWYYNTAKFPDGVPCQSWWDIVQGYNVDTCSYIDASGKNTQYWTLYTKDITSPSYAALWAQLFLDSDELAAQYKAQYGEDLVITYNDKLKNDPDVMTLPEDNAGIELFWRFSQMVSTELDDGDAVVTAVEDSLNGPTLGLCSSGKIDGAENVAWLTGMKPYTATNGASNMYVAAGCDNPAGARLFIMFCMGGDDGKSGCYEAWDKIGHWSMRDDYEMVKTPMTKEEVGLKDPDFAGIYDLYPNVKAYWTYWHSLAPQTK